MKTKSYVLILSTLLAVFAFAAAPAGAEPVDGKEKKAEQGPKRPGGERLEQMRERLGLTDAQVEQLRPIFKAEMEEMKKVNKELGKDATREERREARREVHEKYKPQIDAVLTAEQKEKIAKQRERMEKKGGPGGPGGADGAGPE
jgi:Spy/CpxP family protein refolding chaperone